MLEDAPTIYTVEELQRVLRVGRATAQRIAREIGVRVSPRRLVVPRTALDRFLEREEQTAPS
jgi:hypothetical protein